MEEEHRKAIIKNFVSLVEQTDLNKMVSALYEKGVFSEQMIEPFHDTNKDERSRKRLLYSNITRRGPRAFGHLLDALSESGYWDLVRDLDPNSHLHKRPRSTFSSKSDENQYVSIKNEKKKTKAVVEQSKDIGNDWPTLAPREVAEVSDPTAIPKFNVIKSTHFMEETDEGSKIKLYRTRGPNRGYLVVFSYIDFRNNTDRYRAGADVDCQNLKYLFIELGFRVASYQNLTKEETLQTLKSLQDSCVSKCECLFIVVSSHGYPRRGTADTDVRVSDGGHISVFGFIDHFNDKNFPALRGVPKVFIFQVCRGDNSDWVDARALTDGCAPPPAPVAPAAPPPPPRRDRVYSDILVAHSTLPGYVSHRDPRDGSWFIQALCKVFAAHAHNTDVEKLFALVDDTLRDEYHVQTSERNNWGFNRRLYLHPGLVEGTPPAAHPAHSAPTAAPTAAPPVPTAAPPAPTAKTPAPPAPPAPAAATDT